VTIRWIRCLRLMIGFKRWAEKRLLIVPHRRGSVLLTIAEIALWGSREIYIVSASRSDDLHHTTTQHISTAHYTTQHKTTQHNTTQHNTTLKNVKKRHTTQPRVKTNRWIAYHDTNDDWGQFLCSQDCSGFRLAQVVADTRHHHLRALDALWCSM
jgi:hypothetical protein